MKNFFKSFIFALAFVGSISAEITLVNHTRKPVIVGTLRGKKEIKHKEKTTFFKPLNRTISIGNTVVKTETCMPNSTYKIKMNKNGYYLEQAEAKHEAKGKK